MTKPRHILKLSKRNHMNIFIKYYQILSILIIVPIVAIGLSITYFMFQLPDDSILKSYKPDVMTRVHASNGDLVKEYSMEYRIFIPIEDIPLNIKNAFLSAEDMVLILLE